MFERKENGLARSRRWLNRLVALISLAILGACAMNDLAPLEALDRKIDLEQFIGDWYVDGSISVAVPFFSEQGPHNGV